MKTTPAVLFAVASAVLTACDHAGDAAPSALAIPFTALGAVPLSAHPIEAIAMERCDREERCDNIGNEDSDYSTREACVAQIGSDTLKVFTDSSCPNGIDLARFQACLSAIHEEDCDDPFDTLSRDIACAQGVLCPSWATEVGGYIGGS